MSISSISHQTAIADVLAHMREVQSRTQGASELRSVENAGKVVETEGGASLSFSSVLQEVSAKQAHAQELRTAATLNPDAHSVAEVMLAAQDAQLAFKAVVEVRNRVTQAYQEIMNMPM